MSESPATEPAAPSPTFSVTLSVYEWNRLLVKLEDFTHIVNRYQGETITLWEEIATQLHDRPVRMIHEQNPDPAFRPAKPAAVQSPVVGSKTPSLWRRFRGLFSS